MPGEIPCLSRDGAIDRQEGVHTLSKKHNPTPGNLFSYVQPKAIAILVRHTSSAYLANLSYAFQLTTRHADLQSQ